MTYENVFIAWIQAVAGFLQALIAVATGLLLLKTTRITSSQLSVLQSALSPNLVTRRQEYLPSIPEPDKARAFRNIGWPCNRITFENSGDTAIRPFVIVNLKSVFYADYAKEGIRGGTEEDYFVGQEISEKVILEAIAVRLGPDAPRRFKALAKKKLAKKYSNGYMAMICLDRIGRFHTLVWPIKEDKGALQFELENHFPEIFESSVV